MKIAATLLSVFAVLGVGCSDRNDNKPAATNSAPVSAPVSAPASAQASRIALASDLPSDMKSLPSESGGRCAVDIVNKPLKEEGIAIKRADGFTIYGWALDEVTGSAPQLVLLDLVKGADNYYAPLNRRGEREDLAKAFSKPEFSNAGFGGSVDIAALPTGQYEIRIIQKLANKNLVCTTKFKVQVAD
jgi:hypothetical protein